MKKFYTIISLLLAVILLSGCAFTKSEPAPFTNIKGRTGDTTYQPARLDALSHALEIITFAHHELHEGDSYTIQTFTDIDNGNSLDLRITTPDNPTLIHITIEVQVEAEFEMFLYESGNVTGGNIITPINRKRGSTNTSNTTFTSAPTVTTTGNLLAKQKQVSGERIGGEEREQNEFIFARDTTYLFRLTNTSGSNNQFASVKLNWYEHTSLEP
tara:strand:- start:2488 stop:3129 length:642 start_codon:yes stop_codon:yes gene_type:complete